MGVVVTKLDPRADRMTLVAMIVSRAVLGPIASRWPSEGGLFASNWANLIGEWCVRHYRQYEGSAPGRAILTYYQSWAQDNPDPETQRAMEDLLRNIVPEGQKLRADMRPDMILSIAGQLFERVALQKLNDRVASCLVSGDTSKARTIIEKSRRVEIGQGAGIDVFDAAAEFENALNKTTDCLLKYPDALGGFFGDSLYRGGFITFMGKQKIGKSYILQDVGWRGIENGMRVAYFEAGDSTQDEVLLRFIRRICGRPVKATRDDGSPVRYHVPISLTPAGSGTAIPIIEYERRQHRADLSNEEVQACREAYSKKYAADQFKLSCHPANSISVPGIETVLDTWARDRWYPDIIIVDYADLLAPITASFQKRDQINETWIALRAMSQKRHALVITATQTDADSSDAWVLSRKNFSENFRKYDHVTGAIGINQTGEEKDAGVYRLNWVVPYREMDFTDNRCVWCAGCLSIAQPFILSSF